LLPQHLFIDRHDQYVIEVEFQSRIGKDTDDVSEIIQLMFAEDSSCRLNDPNTILTTGM